MPMPDVFDFLIVGAGASGCVLANRLSADAHNRVLLIEAGDPSIDPTIAAPGKWTSLLETDIDWNYTTEPVPGLDGRRVKWPAGKTYGGSTAINAMAYVRGHPACYDEWAAAAGPAWSFRELLPLFRGLEDNSRGASEYAGAGGPLAVSDTLDAHAGHVAFLESARTSGFEASPAWDFNGARPAGGAGFYQKTIRTGVRESAATAFLTPALSRSNLTVWPAARVQRLTLEGRRATGVEVARHGRVDRVIAARAVILAAGAIETPKILMLSGIGPAAELHRHAIPIVVDLRGVGANLHDHPRVPVRWAARQPLAPSSVSAGLFAFSRSAPAGAPPDLQFYVGRGIDAPDPFLTLTVALTLPRSRGSISLRSGDATAAPVIQPNYFGDAGDIEALVEGVRLARSIGGGRAYAELRGAALSPDDGVRTQEDVRAYIRRTADTMFHPVGTCRMGGGPEAVVDGRLRVHGIEALHVADASVMPSCVNSQTMAACLVIGERAARFLL